MATLAIIGMAVLLVLMLSMSVTAGTQYSISQLARQWRWLLLAALLSQVMILPKMIDLIATGWQWMPFLGIFAIVVCGAASVVDKADNLVHMIAAAVAFVCLFGWVAMVNHKCLMPFVVCAMCGRERFVWRCEVGLIASVYMALLLNI